ncbi:uncharacterized protein DNG_00965 [Cephalotrichum gorgonifer]|uniref:WKF domain-containing protein n=1 Tax=Cephalotrichum gorgonifer TaxID=2041049 RepID=A0AAE8SR78_9PEZI|nr:uncharacterized protein DNG_00965 [Cephalotrichum gorgonifer]
MAQRVPAWQRLGLKLKSAGSATETLSTPTGAPNAPNASFQRDNFESPKRKFQNAGDSPAGRPALKKSRTDDRDFGTPPQRPKSVSFAQGSDPTGQAAAASKKAKSTPKKKKGPKAPVPQGPVAPPDLAVPLDYLRRWKASRESWKFNKNHQTQLINHAFNPTLLPASDIETFYDYVSDIKGYIKTRLLEAAKNITTADMEDKKDHFPQGTTDVEAKEKQYEEIMSVILQRSESASKRKAFNELDYAGNGVDPAVAQRVAKRMRAEIVLEELSSDSDESEATTTTTTTATGEKEADERESSLAKEVSEEPDDAGKRLKLNDGTTRPVKRVRASKRRGADQDSSSSESDSDSDSDSESSDDDEESDSDSSDSSDSSDDSDDEMDVDGGATRNEEDTSSSSSSSSDDDADDDEDSDSD